jgi:hypothetical protein
MMPAPTRSDPRIAERTNAIRRESVGLSPA